MTLAVLLSCPSAPLDHWPKTSKKKKQRKKNRSWCMYWITGSSYVYPSSRPNREDWTPWPNPKLWLCFTSRAVLAHPLCVIANCYCSTKWLPINPVSLPRSWIKLEKRERGRGDVAIVKHDLDRLQRDHTTVCAYACVHACVCPYPTDGEEVYCYGPDAHSFSWDSSHANPVLFLNRPIMARSAVFRVSMLVSQQVMNGLESEWIHE